MADLAMRELGEQGDHWLKEPLREPRDWTDHFARQLGMDPWGQGNVHDTLLLILPEIDRLLQPWPPPNELAVYTRLAHEATKNLGPLELYATLLAGPSRWRQAKLEAACKVDRLPVQLQPILEKALATELNKVLKQWTDWDIRHLQQRRKHVIEAANAKASTEAGTAGPRPASGRLTAREREDLYKGWYQPPGRT